MSHRYQKDFHENKLPNMIPVWDSCNEMLFMKIRYLTSLLCVILVPMTILSGNREN